MRRILAVIIAVIALVAAVPGTAQAAPRATHYFTTFLDSTPTEGMEPTCQPPRVIDIDDAHYKWGQRFGGQEDVVNPDIHLGTDTYIWADCLYPRYGYYYHVSSLDPQNHADWPTAYIDGGWVLPSPDRNVNWGSFLDLIEN